MNQPNYIPIPASAPDSTPTPTPTPILSSDLNKKLIMSNNLY